MDKRLHSRNGDHEISSSNRGAADDSLNDCIADMVFSSSPALTRCEDEKPNKVSLTSFYPIITTGMFPQFLTIKLGRKVDVQRVMFEADGVKRIRIRVGGGLKFMVSNVCMHM